MEFRINLATRVFINKRLTTFFTVAAAILLLSLLAVNCATIARIAGEMKTLAGQLAAMDEKTRSAGKGVTEKEYRELLDRINFANTVIEQKAYNWLQLLDKLELVVPDGVAVSSIMPDSKTQVLKLEGTARAFGNLRIFMERLEDSRFFTDVYLVSQREIKLGDKSPAINFSVTCKVTMK